VHLHPSLKPNARRDGFEQSPDHERFLEQIQLLGKHLSGLCRRSSQERSAIASARAHLTHAERRLGAPFFLDREHLQQALSDVTASLDRAERVIEHYALDGDERSRLVAAKGSLERTQRSPAYLRDCLDGRSLRHLGGKELLLRVCRAITERHTDSCSSEELIRQVLTPFFTKRAARLLADDRE